MKLFFLILALCLAVMAYPYLRITVKRFSLYLRIKRVCRRKGYLLKSAHFCGFWGTNQRSRFDFYIETPNELLCVKLFAAKHKKSVLKLQDGNRLYYFTKTLCLFSRWGQTSMAYNSKLRALPSYDFEVKASQGMESKTKTNILLIHPKCFEIHGIADDGTKRPLATGDTIHGMRLESGKTFLGYL